MRVLRSSLFDVYHEDYIQQARLRGLSERHILLRHALKNASLPTLTLAGVQFGFLFSGTLLVEVIYSYPGMGNLMVDAVRNADLPLIQAIGLTYCIVVLADQHGRRQSLSRAQSETAGALMPSAVAPSLRSPRVLIALGMVLCIALLRGLRRLDCAARSRRAEPARDPAAAGLGRRAATRIIRSAPTASAATCCRG